MARDFFRLEKGLHITGENSNDGVKVLFGSVVAGSVLEHDQAEQGSIYMRTNGELFLKTLSGTGEDKWIRTATLNDITALRWRDEKAAVLTAQAAPASGANIDLTASPFVDDDAPYLTGADFTAGISHILFGKGGTPKIMLVSAVAGNVITVVDAVHPLVNNYAYIVKNYLPDTPDAQEGQAIVLFNGTDYVKIADFNWEFADGIKLAAGYAAASGDISSSDTVQTAVQKLDGNIDALDSALGVAQGQMTMGAYTGSTVLVDGVSAKQNIQSLGTEAKALRDSLGNVAGSSSMGVYTGDILTDNVTVKQNIQELSDYAEETALRTFATGVTTPVTVDSILVDSYQGAIWDLVAFLESNPKQKQMITLSAVHNGTATIDADDTDETSYAKLKVGSPFSISASIVLSGSGATQTMALQVSAGAAVTVRALRRVIK